MRSWVLVTLLCWAVPAAAQGVSRGADRVLLDSVRRIAERTGELRGQRLAVDPIAVRATSEDREAAARARIDAVLDPGRLRARGRAWQDLGLGFSEAPGQLYALLASDLEGVGLGLAPPRVLVAPDRLTPSDFDPEEAGEVDTALLLATGVRPDEPVVAHVLLHLLQVERSDGDVLQETTDALLASAALAEGEANLVALRYLFGAMGLDDTVVEAGLDPGATLQGELLPPAVRSGQGTSVALAQFAYFEGFSRLADVYRQGGWSAVDALWRRPRSTRELLHPGEQPVRPVRPDPPDLPLPEGFGLRDTDVLGEQVIVVLVSRSTGKDNLGLQAGDGWCGDALYRWEPDGAPGDGVTAWVSLWHTEKDARDFAYGFTRALRARFGALPDTSADGVWFRSGTSERPVSLRRDGTEVTVWVSPPALAPDRENLKGSQAGPDSVQPD